VSRYKTERDARKAIELVRVNLNADGHATGPTMSFSALAEHYSKHEMPMDDHSRKAFSTKDTNRGYLRKWILPKWGERLVCDIRTIEVENWLNSLSDLANGSRAKIRNLMSAIYRHAMRYEFVGQNPIRLVRQSSKRKKVPEVLEVVELVAILNGLRLRERVMVLLDAATGLRRGELFGLKWGDVDFANKQVSVTRSVVKQVAGNVKTEASQKPVPLDNHLISDLLAWYRETLYKSEDHYVFATNSKRAGEMRGKQPLWPNRVMDTWIRPIAKAVGVKKHIGWHTFRHTFSTLLKANGEDVKVVQELLRHANSRTTMDIYTQAIGSDKRLAQSRVIQMLVPKRVNA
jgi:integrase